MRLGEDGKLGHLTYCTNIHAGEHWDDVAASLAENLPSIKAQVAPDRPLGVGLRISASMAQALSEPAQFDQLKALLGEDYYVFTVNGFPYGTFHGQPVKDGAYRPDWTDPERVRYTNQISDVLVKLVPEGMTGTISTVPCSFKPWHADSDMDEVKSRCAEHIAEHVAHLWRHEKDSGVQLQLALEPEPFCVLETIAETVEYFKEFLFAGAGSAHLTSNTGLDASSAAEAIARYVGVCYDVCHAAVEVEDPRASVNALADAGIGISKFQLSSALRVRAAGDDAVAALTPFDEPVYLHQTIESRDSDIVRFADLSDAFADVKAAEGNEWRSHFHVPIFLERMERFDTTQPFLREILAAHRENPASAQLDVETYTWDVLPESYRRVSVADAIARELNWVIDQLDA